MAGGAAAQTYEYRIVLFEPEFVNDPRWVAAAGAEVPQPTSIPDQDALGHIFTIESSIATAVNDNGVVVGAAYISADLAVTAPEPIGLQAFVWQGEPTHPSLGVNTLNHIPFWNPFNPNGNDLVQDWSIATDINHDGDVVGYAIERAPGTNPSAAGLPSDFVEGFIAPIEPGLTPQSIFAMNALTDTFNGGIGGFTSAWGITDRDRLTDEVLVAGIGAVDPTGCTLVPYSEPVHWTPRTSNVATELDLLQPSILPRGEARDIAPRWFEASVDPDVERIIGGITRTCLVDADTCSTDQDELVTGGWELLDPYPVDDVAGGSFWPGGQARGVNSIGNMVGSVTRDVLPGPMVECGERAALFTWDPATQSFDLDLLAASPVDPEDETDANAINDSGEIVGLDTFEFVALRWRPGSVVELNDLVALGNCGVVSIRSALDVNEHGWIVGVAEVEYPDDAGMLVPTNIGVLLVPIGDCPEDVDRDGDVDQDDLAAVQNTLGTGSTSCNNIRRICWEDVNGDCVVNQEDVKLVMKAMTRATCGQQTLSGSLAGLWLDSGGMERLESGDESVPAEIESAYGEGSELTTFVNLMILLGEEE
ncbi:MAG: dockerin type I domain-containing protein [Phycisphaerales bacterium]